MSPGLTDLLNEKLPDLLRQRVIILFCYLFDIIFLLYSVKQHVKHPTTYLLR